jgi:thermostable 8-oxoguanine DNA glycosylase
MQRIDIMSLHPIDRQKKNWTDEELEKMFIFCLLDRAMPYEKVCKAFNHLDQCGLTTRNGLKRISYPYKDEAHIANKLREVGYRFPNQTAKFLMLFVSNPIDLRNASRDEIAENVKGIEYKLASMFLRNTRGEEYAVLDVHVKRWLKEKGILFKKYKDQERAFLSLARAMGKTPYELDMEIWQERRIGNKNKSK